MINSVKAVSATRYQNAAFGRYASRLTLLATCLGSSLQDLYLGGSLAAFAVLSHKVSPDTLHESEVRLSFSTSCCDCTLQATSGAAYLIA